jgi:hypothetical protein
MYDKNSAVGIAPRYGLEGPRIEPSWGDEICRTSVRTVPKARQPLCNMCTMSFLGKRWEERGVDHLPRSRAEVRNM